MGPWNLPYACMHVCSIISVVSYSATSWTVVRQATWDSLGKNTGVGSHAVLQGIFPTQGWNWVSCMAGEFFTTELPGKPHYPYKKTPNCHRFQLPEKWLLPSPLISFCTLLALSWSTNDKGLLFLSVSWSLLLPSSCLQFPLPGMPTFTQII